MTQASEQKSWWITLPGILTQLVALITALTGLVAALYQTGVFRHQENTSAQDTAGSPFIAADAPAPVPARNDGVFPIASPPPPASGSPSSSQRSFAIRIGDTLSDAGPTPGAGRIETPGSEDIYRFSASPNQRAYFRILEHGVDMSQIKWRLTDRDEQEVFNTCLGCGDPGIETLTRGGTYILTVGNPPPPAHTNLN